MNAEKKKIKENIWTFVTTILVVLVIVLRLAIK